MVTAPGEGKGPDAQHNQKKGGDMTAVQRLMDINNEIRQRHGYHCRPKKESDYNILLYEIAERIAGEPGLLEAITPADLDQLTTENYHTAREAAEKAADDIKEWGEITEIPLF